MEAMCTKDFLLVIISSSNFTYNDTVGSRFLSRLMYSSFASPTFMVYIFSFIFTITILIFYLLLLLTISYKYIITVHLIWFCILIINDITAKLKL